MTARRPWLTGVNWMNVRRPPRVIIALALGLLLTGLVSSAWGKVFYVDQRKITVRRGPGTDYKILDFLEAGSAVQVQKHGQDQAKGWTLVKLKTDKTGWVLTRFLTDKPTGDPALTARLAETLTARMNRLSEDNTELGREIHRLDAFLREAELKMEALDSGTVEELIEGAALAQRLLVKERRELEQARLAAEAESGMIVWFLVGAVCMGLGMMLGYMTSQIRLPRGFA